MIFAQVGCFSFFSYFLLSFFLSFFPSYSDRFYLLIAGVEDIALDHTQTQKHTHTYTYAIGRTPLDEGSARHRQHTTLTRDKYPCSRWDSNPQSQQASVRRPTP
jgi:hypothetical protein